jgi:hypothetical protein
VFEGLKFEYVDVGDATLRVRHGDDGPAVCPVLPGVALGVDIL